MASLQGLEAWEYNPTDEDQRLAHKYSPNRPVSAARLEELGVLSWKIDVDNCECNPALEKIKIARGYKYWEVITVAPGHLENYEEKIVQFFEEHLHPYDESRLVLEGSGYWDIRNYVGEWIRFRVEKGDLIVLPPGMYHRFTLDTDNYIKAVLLYTESPGRIDVKEPDGDRLQVRKDYVRTVSMNLEHQALALVHVDATDNSHALHECTKDYVRTVSMNLGSTYSHESHHV